MERAEAEAIYDAGRETVVEVLLAMDRRIRQLEARIEKLERQLTKSSRNSSLPPSADPGGSVQTLSPIPMPTCGATDRGDRPRCRRELRNQNGLAERLVAVSSRSPVCTGKILEGCVDPSRFR